MNKKVSQSQLKTPPQKKYSYLAQKHQRHSSLSYGDPQNNGLSESMNQTLNYSPESENSPARRRAMMMGSDHKNIRASGHSEIMKKLVNQKSINDSMRHDEQSALEDEMRNEDIPSQLRRVQDNLNHIQSNQSYRTIQPLEHVPVIKYSSFVEVVSQLREIIHKLQLQDAVHRQELKKLKKQNSSLKENVTTLEAKVQDLEKARQLVFILLMKAL